MNGSSKLETFGHACRALKGENKDIASFPPCGAIQARRGGGEAQRHSNMLTPARDLMTIYSPLASVWERADKCPGALVTRGAFCGTGKLGGWLDGQQGVHSTRPGTMGFLTQYQATITIQGKQKTSNAKFDRVRNIALLPCLLFTARKGVSESFFVHPQGHASVFTKIWRYRL